MWKFHDFPINQILREINIGNSTSAKSGIFTHFEVLNFAFYEIMHFLKAGIYQLNKIYALKKAKMAVSERLDSQN